MIKFNWKKIIIVSLFISVFFGEWLASAHGSGAYVSLGLFPKKYTAITEVFSFTLFFIIILELIIKKKKIITSINTPLIIFSVIYLIVGLFIINNKIIYLLGIRSYFRALILFYSVVYFKDLDDIFLKKILYFILFIALIQLPVAIYQRLFISPYYPGTQGDVVSGTFGGMSSGLITLFMLSVFTVLCSLFMNRTIELKKFILFSACILYVISINQTLITFWILALFFIYVLVKRNRVDISRRIHTRRLLTIFLIPLFFGGIYSIYTKYEGNPKEYFTYSFTTQYYSRKYDPTGLGRFENIRFALKNIIEYPPYILTGVGMGNAAYSFWGEYMGEFYKKYYTYWIDRIFLSRLIWETGLLGVFLWFLILYKLYQLSDEVNKTACDTFNISLGYAGKFIIIISLVSFIYQDAFIRAQFAYPFWFLMGYLQRINNNRLITS